MSNQLFNIARSEFAKANMDWESLAVTVALVDTGVYTFDATDEYYSDVSAGVVGTPVLLDTPTVSSVGGCDGGDTTFTSVSGASIEAIVLFDDTGTAGTSRLIAYIDTATGLPITPNGGNIIVIWDSGTNKIFRL